MTLCRKCGKEIPDGQELCEECQGAEVQVDETYLDELMQSMEQELEEVREPVEEPITEEPITEEPEAQESETQESMAEELSVIEDGSAGESMEELLVDQMKTEELSEDPIEEPAEEPVEEPAEESVEEPTEEQPAEELSGDEDIDELLELLSQDYEDYEESPVEEKAEEEQEEEEPEEISDDSLAEVTLFRENDEDEGIFADDTDALSVDDIFDDALSAVDYSGLEEEEQQEEVLEEFIPPEEDSTDEFDGVALDSLALDDNDISLEAGDGLGETAAEKSVLQPEENEVPKEKKPSIWKRVFGNIITEQSAEEEAKEREKEKASAEEKALAREEKKKKAAEEKAEKAEQAKQEKEKKAAEKAERAAVKSAEKEEKKRLKAEMAAQEVVGRINPLGASIVMVFFGLFCVLVILGTQSLSYTSSVHNAESSFEKRDYKRAYESLAGVDVSESSEEMKEKVRICMQLQRELDAYHNYYEMKMYLESLDSLMKGIRSYDTNKGKAEEFDILGQYNELEGKLANQLYEEFGVSESQARNINSAKTQEEYTSRLENIIAQWEKRNKEDER